MYQNYLKLRDERKLTDYAVAKNTGVPRSTFSDWKTGRCTPKVEKLMKIADFFGVSIDDLVRPE
ncbi:MAG: helix-turn-helix transcriptional regulator [Methanomicrobium sp.]|nr:helix-turn-helix transcriptional regulator [Methanomicrobium sp.]